MSSKFFYGINYSDDEVLRLKKLLLQASQEVSLEALRDMTVDLQDSIGDVDRSWAEQGDPVSIYYKYDEHSDREFACLCVRETFHGSTRTRWGAYDESFNLEGLDLQAWDLLLKAKCERLNIPWKVSNLPWTQPAFCLIATAYPGCISEVERAGYCIYGLYLPREDAVNRFAKLPWSEDDPVALLRVENRGVIDGVEGDEGDLLYLGIRASLMKTKTTQDEERLVQKVRLRLGRLRVWKKVEGIAGLDFPIQKPPAWRELLRAKCEKYGIGWSEPKFYLFVMS